MTQHKRITSYSWLIGGVAVCVGFGAGFFFHGTIPAEKPVSPEVREFTNNYHFINPLLACGDDNFSHLSNQKASELQNKINDIISARKSAGDITDASVYFRELNGGQWLGAAEDTMFTPGSLLKVPLVMSVYKHAEKDPNFLQKQIMYEGGDAPAKEHFAADVIAPGTYSIEGLVEATLKNSDNNAAVLLTKLISPDELNDAYSRLGITIPSPGEDYSMSVQTYASFFRILYNATYLDHDASEALLQTLSQAVFTKGLVAGVPAGTVVAHKFGERSIEGSSLVQLHDCGIVYSPKQPYLICVMMRGKDSDVLANAISDISKVAYEYAE